MRGEGSILALIPARGGSKGVPRKNIKELCGKPLIAYAIETALGSSFIDRVVVSTDDQEIAEVARRYGAEVPFQRPPELATDASPELLTWQHAIRTLNEEKGTSPIEVFVCVPPTAPLRTVADVDSCISALLEDEADLVITVRESERNPYFNMVILDEQGGARLVIPPDKTVFHRQDAPPVYDITTVAYAARPEYILNASSILEGNIRAVVVPAERALDIDTETDFMFADFMLKRTLKGEKSSAPRAAR